MDSQSSAIAALQSSLSVCDANNLSSSTRATLVSQAKDMIQSLQTPQQHVLQLSSDAVGLVALRTVMRIGVLEALPTNDSMSLAELAQKTSCQPALLSRLLRVLVGNRFLKQDEDGNYSHSHISLGYLDQAGIWFTGNLYQPVLEALYHFPLGYMDAEPPRSDGYSFAEPDDTRHNPRVWAWGRDGQNIWDVFATEHPEAMGNFQQGIAMVGDQVPVTGVYNFDVLVAHETEADEERPVVVDVGGGIGQCLAEILRVHPEITASRCILQEQAPLIALAEQNAALPQEVVKLVHDFWTAQPSSCKNAKAYFMRWILHDYSDDAAVKILQHIVDAMAPDSKVLISEAVVPERLDEQSMLAGTLDMYMLVIGGKERTLREFDVLLGRVGLRVEHVWRTEGTPWCTVEAVLG